MCQQPGMSYCSVAFLPKQHVAEPVTSSARLPVSTLIPGTSSLLTTLRRQTSACQLPAPPHAPCSHHKDGPSQLGVSCPQQLSLWCSGPQPFPLGTQIYLQPQRVKHLVTAEAKPPCPTSREAAPSLCRTGCEASTEASKIVLPGITPSQEHLKNHTLFNTVQFSLLNYTWSSTASANNPVRKQRSHVRAGWASAGNPVRDTPCMLLPLNKTSTFFKTKAPRLH